ncbi:MULTISPECIES: 4-oxalocrotonate tautomerase family protein [Campylobacter]|uniref:tautomerase family protein n=1 Tax=Campylobacter TaxID=194 RepID=UPI00067C910B|nr:MULTISPECIES: 4-oxalocrotonate tautomerase family protein [Campylobacter]AKT93369.1 4-oxalocrotonate tautomerase family enzyme [Campylobacter gracilis]UEB46529.1 4-oxalocrotonate tautomerase family protein [Campylobacter gracilis]SUW78304.1 Putative isomerase [Campylobacter gracilis]
MPYINVKITKERGGLSREQKARLVKNLTDALVAVLGRGEKTTVVTIDEISTDDYAIGGRLVSEIRKRQS